VGILVETSKRRLFSERALASGLVTPQQLDETIARLRRSGPPVGGSTEVDDEALAEALVSSGVLYPFQANQLLAGNTKFTLGAYVVIDWIAQGGMGQVFKAEHKLMGRTVAIKVLPKSKTTPEAIASFMREIRVVAQLDHDNLVRAFDAGMEASVYYLVTEYVPGTDLRRLVRTGGRLSMEDAATIIAQAALGLSHAHAQGLIHRDVKPGNLLVTPEGRTKLSDLGLAGFFTDDGEPDPRSGKIVGTADYLSPEQIETPWDLTPASDIYGLGCTLYYAVTGKVPFPGGSTREKAKRHCDRENLPVHPRRCNPEISEAFADVLADMMAKERQERIPSADEVVRRLSAWAKDTVGASRMSQATGATKSIAAPPIVTAPPPPPPPPRLPNTSAGSEDGEGGPFTLHVADRDGPGQESWSQTSQGTWPVASAGEETLRVGQMSEELARTRSPGTLVWVLAAVCGLLTLALAAVATFWLLAP